MTQYRVGKCYSRKKSPSIIIKITDISEGFGYYSFWNNSEGKWMSPTAGWPILLLEKIGYVECPDPKPGQPAVSKSFIG